MVSSSRAVVAASCCLSALVAVDGFIVLPSKTNDLSATQLYGRRVMKRGSLGDIDSEGSSSTRVGPRRSTRQQRKAGSSRKKKGSSSNNKSDSSESAMSADLAKFLNDSSEDGDLVDVEVVERKPSKSERRQKQTAKKAVDKQRGAKVEAILDELQGVLEERTGKVQDILTVVEKLLAVPSDTSDLRRILSAKDRSDYRLAWVGSDDAICHLGTGLHKVPLARMQEVFMNCLGRNKVEILEVISLIGPFPNVKNILQGNTKISGGSDGSEIQIVMEKMVDGTGKTIDAGTDDNIRRVDLEVAFSDERAIVALLPDEGNPNAKPLDNDGKRVLLFVKEDDLDEQLEKLRVNEID